MGMDAVPSTASSAKPVPDTAQNPAVPAGCLAPGALAFHLAATTGNNNFPRLQNTKINAVFLTVSSKVAKATKKNCQKAPFAPFASPPFRTEPPSRRGSTKQTDETQGEICQHTSVDANWPPAD